MAIIIVTVIKYNTLSVGIQRFSQHISDNTGGKIAHCDIFKIWTHMKNNLLWVNDHNFQMTRIANICKVIYKIVTSRTKWNKILLSFKLRLLYNF